MRQSLDDVITNISPTDTPFFSNCSHGTAKSNYETWEIDALPTASAANAQIDGDEFSNTALTAAAVVGNYAQISWKVLGISRRADKLTKAGRKSEVAYQLAKEGAALKKDVEAVLMAFGATHTAAAAGSSSSAGTTASLGSWMTTNRSIGGGSGAAPALSGTTYGSITTAPVDGTDRALTEDNLLNMIRGAYVAGGNPNTVMCSPTVKQNLSKYLFGSSARIATPMTNVDGKKGASVIGAVDFYMSDFGRMEIVPNRVQRDDDVYILDFDYWEIRFIDKFVVQDLAKSGDGTRKAIVADYVLVSKNEAASATISDIDEALAITAS